MASIIVYQVTMGSINEHQEGFTIRRIGQIPSTRSRTRQRGRYRHLGLDETQPMAKVTAMPTPKPFLEEGGKLKIEV